MIEQIRSKIGQPNTVKDMSQVKIAATMTMFVDIETFGSNKKPGDAPYFAEHGIAGISVGNVFGDSMYVVVNDNKNYGGVPIATAIEIINRILAESVVKNVVLHYGKFDLGFLLKRGLKVDHLRVIDTWILRNLKSKGVYSANKLKDLMRKKFNIPTDTEKEKDEWMEKHDTEDYGDVPVEIMGAYAADDVRFTALALLSEAGITDTDWKIHDLYIRNTRHLIKAERYGVALDIALLKSRLEKCVQMLDTTRAEITANLGGAQIDLNDDQAIMRYLHEKNMHSAPREQYGEVVYVFDEDFLLSFDHPLPRAYWRNYKVRMFMKNFSGQYGDIGTRIWGDAKLAGIHPDHLLSTFSRGGIPQLRRPDVTERVQLDKEIRQMFVPRPGHKLVLCRALDLPVTLFALYAADQDLMAAVRVAADADTTQEDEPGNVVPYMAKRAGFDVKDWATVSLLWRQMLEGSGMDRLEQRLRGVGVKGKDKKACYGLRDKFAAAWPGLANFRAGLEDSLKTNGFITDRVGRVLAIEEKSRYRAHSMLLQSSVGSILSVYLDMFCRVAEQTGAQLVVAHEHEFLFETPVDNTKFVEAAYALSAARPVEPQPVWMIQTLESHWEVDRSESDRFWRTYL